jgi:hypothetical protein
VVEYCGVWERKGSRGLMESTERDMGERFKGLRKRWVSRGHGGTVQERFIYFGVWQKEKEEIRRIEVMLLVFVGYKGRVKQRWGRIESINATTLMHRRQVLSRATDYT